MKNVFKSWGNLNKNTLSNFVYLNKNLTIKVNNFDQYTTFGNGRSYGDVCLTDRGLYVDTSNNNKILKLNKKKKLLNVQSGVMLSKIFEYLTDSDLTLPVVPGTKFITVGGAIANDIHGKNHHYFGSFGNHIESIKILRSDGKIYTCSKRANKDLFYATIGGLGLTGIIIEATLILVKHYSDFVNVKNLPFYSIGEFIDLSSKYKNFNYIVGWLDVTSKKNRGILELANFSNITNRVKKNKINKCLFSFPNLRFNILFKPIIILFNYLYFYNLSLFKKNITLSFFKYHFPLDSIKNWNNMYGSNGFYQLQFSFPKDTAEFHIDYILNFFKNLKQNSFLTTIKCFGSYDSPGMLGFVQNHHITVALDFINSKPSVDSIKEIQDYIADNNGRIYLAKDALMTKSNFYKIYGKKTIQKFLEHKDKNSFSLMYERLF